MESVKKLTALKEAIAIVETIITNSVMSQQGNLPMLYLSVDQLNGLNPLVDLAEQVVALEGKMPAKKEHSGSCEVDIVMYPFPRCRCGASKHNSIVDLCTKAFVGMLGEKTQPEDRIAEPLCEISFNKGRVVGRNSYRAEILKKIKGE